MGSNPGLSARENASAGVNLKSEAGMSLVEVMIVSSIAMVLALGMATMITNQQHSVKAIQTKSDFTTIGNSVRANATSDRAVMNSLLLQDP